MKLLAAAMLACILLVVVAASARPLSPEAQAELDKGIADYSAKRYEAAIQHFRAAHAIDPQPEVLFAWAQAERLSGDCESAIELYRRFLEQSPAPEEEKEAAVHLSRCERALETKPAKPQAQPVRKSAPRKKIAPPPKEEEEPWYADVAGAVLAATGVAAAGVGAGLLIAAEIGEPESGQVSSYDEFDDQAGRADRFRMAGAICLGVGAALIVAAVVRYGVRGSRAEAKVKPLSISF